MAATLVQFRALVPAMASVADATVTAWLALTLPRINPDLFGTQADTAQVWLTAHELARDPATVSATMSAALSAAPGATSISVGPVSVTYGSAGAPTPGAELSRTVWGQRFADLQRVAQIGAASLLMPAGVL